MLISKSIFHWEWMNMEDKEVGLLISAMKIASRQHKNQRRKDEEKSPYINHPINVVDILWKVGGVRDAEVLIAALLHDTLEDTIEQGTVEETNLKDEIAGEFGIRVLSLVENVTDDKSLDKAVRKQIQVDHARNLPDGAKLIKLADKISNIQDVAANPPSWWDTSRKLKYLHWAEQVVAGLRRVNPALEKKFDEALAIGKANLEQ